LDITIGGTNNTLHVFEAIKIKKKHIVKLFNTYNTKFRSKKAIKYTIDCDEVSDKDNGSFWMGKAIEPFELPRNRNIVDTWCKLERAKEELSLIRRDTLLLMKHCMFDINTLGSPIYPDGITDHEKRAYQAIIDSKKKWFTDLLSEIKSCSILMNLVKDTSIKTF
jgi:hypothetical protein